MNRWVVKAACAVLLSGAGLAFRRLKRRRARRCAARLRQAKRTMRAACVASTLSVADLRRAPAAPAAAVAATPSAPPPAAPPPTPGTVGLARRQVRRARRSRSREARGTERDHRQGHGSRHQAARRARGHARQRAGVGRTHRELEDQGEGGRHGEDRVRRAGLLRADRTERPLEQSRARALRAAVLSGLAASPDVYLQKVDLARDAALLVQLSESGYRAASFLDDRILTSDVKGSWVSLGSVLEAAQAIGERKPLHFIFHTGHVGSTLLSRLLDESGCVLSLREPLPLRTLADARDVLGLPESLLSSRDFDALEQALLKLWSRGYQSTHTVVLKATSSACRIAAQLLERHDGAHGGLPESRRGAVPRDAARRQELRHRSARAWARPHSSAAGAHRDAAAAVACTVAGRAGRDELACRNLEPARCRRASRRAHRGARFRRAARGCRRRRRSRRRAFQVAARLALARRHRAQPGADALLEVAGLRILAAGPTRAAAPIAAEQRGADRRRPALAREPGGIAARSSPRSSGGCSDDRRRRAHDAGQTPAGGRRHAAVAGRKLSRRCARQLRAAAAKLQRCCRFVLPGVSRKRATSIPRSIISRAPRSSAGIRRCASCNCLRGIPAASPQLCDARSMWHRGGPRRPPASCSRSRASSSSSALQPPTNVSG